MRLNCTGTKDDLTVQHVDLHEGQVLLLYSEDLDDQGQSDELLVEGVVTFSEEESCWVASVDWTAVRRASSGREAQAANGQSSPSPTAEGRIKL